MSREDTIRRGWTKIDYEDQDNTLPDLGERVIGYGKDSGISIVKLALVGFFLFWKEGCDEEPLSLKSISHWMPLPAPPKSQKR